MVSPVATRLDPILVVVSPPRSGSTALARSFWRHPQFRWYVHEPYDLVYHQGAGEESARSALRHPLEVNSPARGRKGLIVKEMTFQAGHHVAELADLASLPVVVTVRDPRLSVESRMRQRFLAGQEPCFPIRESGWPDLVGILEWLRTNNRSHVIVDMSKLRAQPEPMLGALCELLGLTYTPQMLHWPAADEVNLGQLAEEQSHWYQRVLRSSGLEAPTEEMPELSDFPPQLREHVAQYLEVYRDLDEGPLT
jgi:hypothetical protein